MHKLRLVTVTATLVLLVSSVFAAQTAKPTAAKKPAAKPAATKPAAAKPAAKPAAAKPAPPKPADKPAEPTAAKPSTAPADFNQEKVLNELRNAPDSTVVATVNGEKITKGELMKALWDWNAPATLDELVTQKMIAQAANKAGVKITEADMNKKIEETKQRMPGEFNEVLRRYNLTKARFLSGTRTSLLAEKTVEKSIKVTDAQIAEFIRASHVLVRFPQGEQDKAKGEAEALEKAKKIYEEIKAGKDFATAAKEYSEDPSNKDKGGDLGWFKKGRMVKEFEDKAFAMKTGEVSEPVKTFYGYHIIKLDKLGKAASEEEKAELSKQILEQTRPVEMQKWFTDLKASAKIENKINPPLPEPPAPPAPASTPSGSP